MSTLSGKLLNIENPKPNQIVIEDIATGLANHPHFAGQTNKYFSVAQHSIMVADLVPDHLKLAALLHDASEAYYGDLIKPLKVKLPMFRYYEEKLMKAIFQKFEVDYSLIREVKEADLQVQQIEYRSFWEKSNEIEDYLTASMAKECYLAYFYRLTTIGKELFQ